MHQDVQHHIQSCHQCQLHPTLEVEIPLTVSTPATIVSKIHVDVMNMPLVHGYKYIVAAGDDLSQAAGGRALKNIKAKTVAKLFWEDIVCRYGCILQVVTDNGSKVKEAFAEPSGDITFLGSGSQLVTPRQTEWLKEAISSSEKLL